MNGLVSTLREIFASDDIVDWISGAFIVLALVASLPLWLLLGSVGWLLHRLVVRQDKEEEETP